LLWLASYLAILNFMIPGVFLSF